MPHASRLSYVISSVADGHRPGKIRSRGGRRPARSLRCPCRAPRATIASFRAKRWPAGREPVVPAKSSAAFKQSNAIFEKKPLFGRAKTGIIGKK